MSQATDTTLERFVNHLVQGFTPELARHFAELPQPTMEVVDYWRGVDRSSKDAVA